MSWMIRTRGWDEHRPPNYFPLTYRVHVITKDNPCFTFTSVVRLTLFSWNSFLSYFTQLFPHTSAVSYPSLLVLAYILEVLFHTLLITTFARQELTSSTICATARPKRNPRTPIGLSTLGWKLGKREYSTTFLGGTFAYIEVSIWFSSIPFHLMSGVPYCGSM
jgi:hypothetical protein